MTELQEIRNAILKRWSPILLDADPVEQQRLQSLWAEISTAESSGSWTMVTASTGRLAEGLLRRQLVRRGVAARGLDKANLHSLIRTATSVGVAASDGYSPNSYRALNTLRRLRNAASHLDLSADADIGEHEATQQLVVFVAVAAAIAPFHFGEPRPPAAGGSLESTWQTRSPRQLLRLLESRTWESARAFVSPRLADLSRHVVAYGRPRALTSFRDLLRTLDLPVEPLAEAITSNFAVVLANLRDVSLRHLVEVVTSLKSLGLRTHAHAIAGTIWLDDDTFVDVVKRSSAHKAARRVVEIGRANPIAFQNFRRDFTRSAELASLLWKDWNGEYSFVSSRFVLIHKMNAACYRDFLGAAPPEALVIWAEHFYLASVIRALVTCDKLYREPSVRHRFAAFRAVVMPRLLKCDVRQVRNVPWLLSKQLRARPILAGELAGILLARVEDGGGATVDGAIRILWDVLQTQDRLRTRVIAVAQALVGRATLRASPYDFVATVGLLQLCGAVPGSLSLPSRDVFTSDANKEWAGDVSSFECALAQIGYFRLFGSTLGGAIASKAAAMTLPHEHTGLLQELVAARRVAVEVGLST